VGRIKFDRALIRETHHESQRRIESRDVRGPKLADLESDAFPADRHRDEDWFSAFSMSML
jgi:hypothetical protein